MAPTSKVHATYGRCYLQMQNFQEEYNVQQKGNSPLKPLSIYLGQC